MVVVPEFGVPLIIVSKLFLVNSWVGARLTGGHLELWHLQGVEEGG